MQKPAPALLRPRSLLRVTALAAAVAASGLLVNVRQPAAAAPGPDRAEARAAVERALPQLYAGMTGYVRQRGCFSCHNQAVPILALAAAKKAGIPIDEGVLKEQVEFTRKSLSGGTENYRKGNGQGGQVDTAGYALLALQAGGASGDGTTSAVAEYLVLRDAADSHWKTSANRPPSELSQFTPTYLALRGIAAFGSPEQRERAKPRVEQALAWLRATPAKDTEDRVFRLLGLHEVGAPAAEIAAEAEALRKEQRRIGGWAQLPDLAADAYATGTALWALHATGSLREGEEAFQRGLRFLRQEQLDDGSWRVVSRSRPFQPYFESGFPHGTDQFISMAASAWATTVLATAANPANP